MNVIDIEFAELEDDGQGGFRIKEDTTDYSRQDAWLAKFPSREDIDAQTLWWMLASFAIAIEDKNTALEQIRALQPTEPVYTDYEHDGNFTRAWALYQAAQIADAAIRQSGQGKEANNG